jgi:diaminohydroxyphosphoribosylaminopyrimidine deaminase/5-amino-6-(5-phosphoribosylamino)uracil reductase
MVIVKAAMSADRKIAAKPGERTFISSAAANRRTQRLRASVDAIGVGSGTLLTDDPALTVRELYRSRPLARVIFDRRLRTPSTARVFSTRAAGPVIIVSTADAVRKNPDKAQRLVAAGATLVEGAGDLRPDLRELIRFDVSTLLVEGGGVLHAAAWRAGVVDRVHLIVAPTTLGDGGVKAFDGIDVPMSEWITVRVDQLGPDQWMEADVHGHR